MSNLQNINNAKNTIRQLLPLVELAEREFRSARNWGFLDIFGGGLLVDLFKHSKLSSAKDTMNQIANLLSILQSQIKDLTIPVDYRMQFGFSTFADFLFDGAFFDIYMQTKIMNSLEQIKQLKTKLQTLLDMLGRM